MYRFAVAIAALLGATEIAAQSAVSQSVFNNIVHYTHFAAASYADDCPTPPFGSSIVQFFNNTPTDTQATLFHDTNANELILALRGTSTPNDLDTDFLFNLVPLNITGTSCSACKVHEGFQSAYASISDAVSPAVTRALSVYPGARLIVTGHSLGAALASLASSSLVAQGHQLSAVYTYGEPRNGDPNFANYINSQVASYFRVTHFNDGVPQIPPTLLGFQHHGIEYWESMNTSNTATSTFNCGGGEHTICNPSTDFGTDPINGAHIYYSNILVASSLFNVGCGYVEPS